LIILAPWGNFRPAAPELVFAPQKAGFGPLAVSDLSNYLRITSPPLM